MNILNMINGRKTYGIGIGLLLYIAIQFINKEPVDMTIVTGGLAGMGITMRHAVSHEVETNMKPFLPAKEE